MKYRSGETVQLNDTVLIEGGRTLGTVQHVVETEMEMKKWKLQEQGVLLKSLPFGTVFWPLNEKDDPIIFVSRSTT